MLRDKGGRAIVLAGVIACFAAFLVGCPNSAGISCPIGQQFCGSKCVFVGSDQNNCGRCGVACPTTLACINSACGCPSGLKQCTDKCVDTQNDPNNCGGCGTACGAGLACVGGVCGCTAGLTNCSGTCANLQTDEANCGVCGTDCGSKVCSQGACAGGCAAPLSNCSGSCVDEKNDPRNCGACGNACGANFFCAMGTCTLQCPGNLMRCTNAAGAQYCADVANDSNNCGGCGTVCDQTAQTMSQDMGSGLFPQLCCASVCTNVSTPDNCGACGAMCPAGLSCVPQGGFGQMPSPLICEDLR